MEALSAAIIQDATPEQLMENQSYRTLQVHFNLAQRRLKHLLSTDYEAKTSTNPSVKYIRRQFEGDKEMSCYLPPDADTQYDYDSRIHLPSKAIIYYRKNTDGNTNGGLDATKQEPEDFKPVGAAEDLCDKNNKTLYDDTAIAAHLMDLQDTKTQALKKEDCN
ncbi:hypothetical protein V5O48_012064 [Marasmius crinis-equi]|uniref:Uncharacterized protein n=1 Tax=Marasmius crinis-equi TaxID=585013 RepID=A0ABR3F3W0_9AGAR